MILANGAIRNILALAAVLPTICCLTPAIAAPPSDGEQRVLLREEVLACVPERLLTSLTATQALAEFRSGRLTSERYVQALIRRIEQFPELNAVIHIEPAEALAAARAADHARAGGDDAPLLGLPILLKDSIDTDSLPRPAARPRWPVPLCPTMQLSSTRCSRRVPSFSARPICMSYPPATRQPTCLPAQPGIPMISTECRAAAAAATARLSQPYSHPLPLARILPDRFAFRQR